MRVDLGTISEDLRQRVLTAIAHELELDEAERQRSGASPPVGTGASPANGASASRAGVSGAGTENGSGAGSDNGMSADVAEPGGGLDYGIGVGPVYASPWERVAAWPGTPAQPGDIARAEPTAQSQGAGEDAAAAQEPGAAAEHEDAINAADGQGEAAPGPAVPLPRRAPGTHGAPPPPTELRREYLPPSLAGRRLDPEAHTEPLPRIPGTGPGPGGPAESGSGQSAPSVFTPIRRAAAPAATPAPAGSAAEPGPAEPGPLAPVPSTAGSVATPAETEGSSAEAGQPGTVPADPAPPRSAASAAAIAAASAPTMPVGSAALTAASAPTMPTGSAATTAASAPTMPAGSAAMAAAARFAPPAGTDQGGADPPPPADLATAPASPRDVAAPAGQATPPLVPPPPLPPSTSAQSRQPTGSVPAPSGYGWTADPGGPRPGGGGPGPAKPLPAALPTAKRPQQSGRPYRIAGVILAVVALIVAGLIALLLSGGSKPGHRNGLGPPSSGAGAVVRTRVAAWVAGQTGRTAVVACDPVMCQALVAHGVAASRLYQLGPQATSPLRSQIIVATATVRARFGNVLSSAYAPAVLASFGAGADRIDIRATAQHGAPAYRALLSSDLASRKASGAQLLHSHRIGAAILARRELAEGEVDGRLLITITQMAAAHPMFIVDFGSPAPGANPDMPLRQADLSEDAHARHHAGHAISVPYVRAMVSFLRAQHRPFRPARMHSVYLPDGAAVLRIEFTAPSPLGLLGAHV